MTSTITWHEAVKIYEAAKSRKPKLNFTILTKEEVEAGRPKDAYNYIL